MKAPQQLDAATFMLHGWDCVLQLTSFPHLFFPPNIKMVIMARYFHFCFLTPVDISTKGKSLSPCLLANCSPDFSWCNFFFLAEQPFRLCR